MNKPDWGTPVAFLLWVAGVLVFACVARVGWHIGERLLAVF